MSPEPEAAGRPEMSATGQSGGPGARSPARRSNALEQAIAHLNQIVADVREVLADLEDVADLLEVAESQKQDAEREIETLRRTLNQLQRFRDSSRSRSHGPTAATQEGASSVSGD